MRAYIYCSYKFSPVGFQMGVIDYNPATTEDYIPENQSLNKFVVTAFEQGIITKIYGLIPSTAKYVYIIRKLKKNNVIDDNEGEIDLYMNFAFEFDDFNEYKNFRVNFENLDDAEDECAKFIVTDRSVKTYALKVKAAEFNNFVEQMLTATDSRTDSKSIYVEVVPSKPQEEILKELFHCDFENLGNKKYCHPVKKKSPIQIIALCSAVVAIILMILWYICL